MALSLQNVKDSFARLKKDISDVDNTTFIEWCNYLLHFFWRKLAHTSPDVFYQTQNYNVVANQDTYALPTNIDSLTMWGTGLYEVNNGIVSETPVNYVPFGSSQWGYYLNNGNIVFTPQPTQNKQYLLRYYPSPPEFTSLSDYFTFDKTALGQEIIPSQFRLYIVRALDVLYSDWDEEVGMESFADARFVRALSEILDHIRVSPSVYYTENQFDVF